MDVLKRACEHVAVAWRAMILVNVIDVSCMYRIRIEYLSSVEPAGVRGHGSSASGRTGSDSDALYTRSIVYFIIMQLHGAYHARSAARVYVVVMHGAQVLAPGRAGFLRLHVRNP